MWLRSDGLATNGAATRWLRPSRRRSRPIGRSVTRPTPVRRSRASNVTVSSSMNERGERRGVVGLVEPRVLQRDRQARATEEPSGPGADPLDPLDRRGRAAREPDPPVAGEALLGREVVHVELRGVHAQAARARRRVDDHEPGGTRRAAHLDHDAGRGLVVRVGVDVDGRVGDEVGMRAGGRLDDERVVEERRARVTAANFEENSPNTRCSARRSTSPNAAASQNAVLPPLPSSTS